jgi:hypothetical protein
MVARAREMGFPVEQLVRDDWSARQAAATPHE